MLLTRSRHLSRPECDAGVREEQIHLLLDNLIDSVVQLDENGCYVYCSPSVAGVFGLTAQELLGTTARSRVHPDDLAGIQQLAKEALASGSHSFLAEHRFLHGLGSYIWVESAVRLLVDAGGGLAGSVASTRDVTQRRRAEDELRARDRMLARTAELVPGMIYQFTVRPDGSYSFPYASAWCEHMFGISPDALKEDATLLSERVLAEDRPSLEEAMARSARTLELFQWEGRIRTVNGECAWYQGVSKPERQADGSIAWNGILIDISERKRAEEALHRQQEFANALLENMADAVVACDAEGRVAVLNRVAREWHGFRTPHAGLNEWPEAYRLFAGDGVTPLDPEAVPLARAFRGEKLRDAAVVIRAEGQPDRQVAADCSPFYDNSGRLLGAVAVGRDVSGSLRMQRELAESEERLRLALQAANQGLYDLNVQTGEASVSPEYAAMLGYDPAEFKETNQAWIERLHPDDREATAATYREYIAGRIPEYRVEFRQRTSSGDWKWILSLGKVVERDSQGRPLRMLGTHTDITRRKQVEEERAQALALISAALAQSPSGILIADAASGAIRWANRAALEVHGDTQSPLPGFGAGCRSQSWQCHRPDGTPYTPEELPLSRALRQGETVGDEVMLLRGAPGEDRWLSVNAAPIRDGEGRIASGIVVVHDVTDRKRAEIEQDRLRAQLEHSQKMESVGRLAGGVAHDFNNMLGLILGQTEMALASLDAGHPVSSRLKEIQKAAQRSAQLTRQLLAFARAQTATPKILDLNATVSGMLTMLRRLIGEHIELVWTPGQALGTIRIDPSQIDQVLANLCVNARDAIHGVGRISIDTGEANFDEAYCLAHPEALPGRFVRLTVSDNGRGMDAETLGKIFEPYFTTKAAGEGTGLGLPMIYGIVQQNLGFLTVCSEPGVGTSFSIYLPRHEEDAAGQPAVEDAPEEHRRGQETILLVEDEPAILLMTTEMLEACGYRVLATTTPREALREAAQHKGQIHLLMTDVIMPEMNGLDLSRELSTLHPGLRLIFMSGYTADIIGRHGVLEEGVQFLPKPFTLQDLEAKVRRALES